MGGGHAGHGSRTALVVAHIGRRTSVEAARLVTQRLTDAGLAVRVLDTEAADIGCAAALEVPTGPRAAEGVEVVIVVGGDGTLLRAAELARPAGASLLGVNLGHVGFLAETEPDGLADTVDRVIDCRYVVERRMTVDVTVRRDGDVVARTWALNEATVEKAARERMVEVVIGIDGRPLSRWGCDGVVCATPTGSTAYAFSAGGPVVWPEVEALLLVPISAHALFARPLVVSPRATLSLAVADGHGRSGGTESDAHRDGAVPANQGTAVAGSGSVVPATAERTRGAVLWCDSRRQVQLAAGDCVEVRRGALPVLLARMPSSAGDGSDEKAAGDGPGEGELTAGAAFTNRLVVKFGLSVAGWRGARSDGKLGSEGRPAEDTDAGERPSAGAGEGPSAGAGEGPSAGAGEGPSAGAGEGTARGDA